LSTAEIKKILGMCFTFKCCNNKEWVSQSIMTPGTNVYWKYCDASVSWS